MGHTGEAMLMLMPHERPYVELLAAKGIKLDEMAAEGPLRWLPQVYFNVLILRSCRFRNRRRRDKSVQQVLCTCLKPNQSQTL